MNKDLSYVLHGQMPRSYGERPERMGNFEQIAPSQESEDFLRLIGGQKMFNSAQRLTNKQTGEVRGIGSLPEETLTLTPKRRH